MIRILLAAAVLCALVTNADARQRHKPGAERSCIPTSDIMRPCEYNPNFLAGVKSIRVTMKRENVASLNWRDRIRSKPVRVHRQPRVDMASYGAPTPSVAYTVNRAVSQVIGGRPAGCPHAFCGCGASLQVFGRIIPSLNLAANWLRFPRTAPAPGMVAARRGHVFVLREHLGGNVWLAHDSNSGGHLTRLHPRSIAGYSIVNPHGGAA